MMTCELVLATALLAPAQTTAVLTVTETPTGTFEIGVDEAHRRPVDEQIEVMRALLLRKLGGGSPGVHAYPSLTTANLNPSAVSPFHGYSTPLFVDLGTSRIVPFPAVTGETNVEGAYLDGYGVVFNLTVPATGRDPRPGAAEPKENPGPSDWDREQRRLRGEPVPARTTAAPKEPPVSDVLLKLLAENGKHFTSLKDDERVTIAVTFRGVVVQSAPGANPKPIATFTAPGAKSVEAPQDNRQQDDQVASMELLGDLHMKQGQLQQSVEAYRKAVTLAENEAKRNPAGREARDRLSGALSKLAQALLATGNLEEASSTLDRATALSDKRVPTANPAAKPVIHARPARLTISVPKKLLDQVGNGKMSVDEFRKQATIEYVPAGKMAGE